MWLEGGKQESETNLEVLQSKLRKRPYLRDNKKEDVKGNGNPLQYSCLENPMDRVAWYATVHVVAKSWTGLSNFTFTFKEEDRM